MSIISATETPATQLALLQAQRDKLIDELAAAKRKLPATGMRFQADQSPEARVMYGQKIQKAKDLTKELDAVNVRIAEVESKL